jgi:hypothetical protein
MIIRELDAIYALHPNADYAVSGDGKITAWNEKDKVQPSEAEIDAKLAELQALYDAQEYARSRKTEYDKLNQNEMMYDDKVNGTTTWEDAIIAIKAKYPKPE